MRIYVDMDDVLCDYSAARAREKSKNPNIAFPQSVAGFFRGLTPISGAIAAMEKLQAQAHISLYILSAPSTRNPLSYTEKRLWVEEKLGYAMAERLILCSNKGLLKGDILIDDHACGRGQENFEGRLIHFGHGQFSHWGAVLDNVLDNKPNVL